MVAVDNGMDNGMGSGKWNGMDNGMGSGCSSEGIKTDLIKNFKKT